VYSIFVHSEGAARAYFWSQSPPAATTGRAMPWWQGPTYHSSDKFNYIVYSHQPTECLVPRQQSWKNHTPHPQVHGLQVLL